MTKNSLECRGGHQAETIGILHQALKMSEERNDNWGYEVKYHLSPHLENGDLVAEEAKYHHDCLVI